MVVIPHTNSRLQCTEQQKHRGENGPSVSTNSLSFPFHFLFSILLLYIHASTTADVYCTIHMNNKQDRLG
uniref:Uncharacterized protein n=1 Tax=Anguilla anguilla TaxID=7936 RepID=A0A0E9PLA4_ANGAN